MMNDIEKLLEQRDLRYKESEFWDNPIIGKEVVRFRWYHPKYKGHFKTIKGIKYFDDFIMTEIKNIAEKNNERGFSSWMNSKPSNIL